MRAVTTTVVAGLAMLAFAPGAAAATRAYEANTVIVKYRGSADAAQRSLVGEAAGLLNRVARVRGTGAQLFRVLDDPRAVAQRLSRYPAVKYAEPNWTVRATAVFPNDQMFSQQWGHHNTGQSGGLVDADIDAPEGWEAAALGAFPVTGGAKIGIVDTGIQGAHEDLNQPGKVANCAGVNRFPTILLGLIVLNPGDPTVVPNKCADDNGHGTHVAGTAAATANNGRGVAGVAFNSPLAICKGLDSTGSGGIAGVANCVAYLRQQDAKVISMSLSTTANSSTLQNAVRNATNGGSLVVAAAGNTGNSTPNYPAAYPEVVSVAATDRRDNRASFSTFNNDVEVAGPGVDILSTWNNGGYNSVSGTSMATPYAAGVAAIIAGRLPAAGVAGWRAELQSSVDDKGAPGRDPQFGFGRLNLFLAAT
jgi:thermitase